MIRNRLILLFALLVSGITYAQDGMKITINTGKTLLEVTQTTPGQWDCKVEGIECSVIRNGNKFELYRWGDRFASGAIKAGKLNLYRSDESAFFSLKLDAEKIKLYVGSSTEAIEFKSKPDKIKVVVNDKEVGKVKFYADSGKCKAKNANEETVAESKDLKKLSAALAPFVVTDLNTEIRIFSMLTLLALDQ